MLNWKEIVEKYIIRHSDRIKKATQPLRDHFGVSYFTYHRIDHDGKYTVLVDRPDWAEHYVSEKVYLNDPYLRHPEVYESGICLVESHGSEEYKEMIMQKGKQVLNADIGALLIEKQEGYVEFFGFAGNKATSCLENLYVNHPALLKSFSKHFRKQLSPILCKMEEDAALLSDLKGEDFLTKDLIHPKVQKALHLNYLKDLGLQSEIAKAQKLSSREKECLLFLLEGKSAKETAAFLFLSVRTIESYFENIKNKLSCSTKQEVLSIAKELHALGLL